MARPTKNYCEYFSHDRDMRNHRKVKAIRTKFGVQGYGLWCMILEYLTGIDGNVFEYSETELELMGGDFGVSVTEIRELIDYCIKLEILFIKNCFINSDSLDERLKSVYDKRKTSKDISKQQQRKNGKFCINNPVVTVVSVTETPQSKVNKSKVKEIKEDIEYAFDSDLFKNVFNSWIKYRKEKKKTLTESTIKMQCKMLKKYPENVSIKIIETSITNGWIGLIEPKNDMTPSNNAYQSQLDTARNAYKPLSL